MDLSFQKTRIAPTPSGYLHRGNAFSFLLTAALAKKTGARLLLRIDDLDRQRVRPAYVQDIFDTLQRLQIGWNEGPRSAAEHEACFSQTHRLPLYRNALQQLRDTGQVFACSCSRTAILRHNAEGVYPGTCLHKGLSLDAAGVSWRLRTHAATRLQVKHLDGSITAAPLPPDLQFFVVQKKDGQPAYQLASLVDDLHFGVNLVVRGADLWPSTLAQLLLAERLQQPRFGDITFYHHPLLKDSSGAKLSKSAGAPSVRLLSRRQLEELVVLAEQEVEGL